MGLTDEETGPRAVEKTAGMRMLARHLANRSQPDLATLLDVAQQTISAWKRGTRRPSSEMRDRLTEVLEIPSTAWLTREEREARRQFARRRAA